MNRLCLLLAALALVSCAEKIDDSTTHAPRGLTARAHPWWDDWPRPTTSESLATIQALHANMVVAGGGVSDEGRGAFYRENWWLDDRANIAAIQAAGIRYTGWIESQGQARTMIGAVHRLPGGGYEQDPRSGAALLVSNPWTWDLTGPGINPSANEIVWMGLHTFVNGDAWQGPFTRANDAIDPPTYPDGRAATGFLKAGSTDPRDATLYDAICAKSITGVTAITADYMQHSNTTGLLPYDFGGAQGVQLVGDMSPRKDTASPFWLQYARTIIDFNLRNGGDGFWMDNSTGFDSLSAEPTQNAFGLWSVAKFRDYLRAHPEVSVPGDIGSFDIRAYLTSKGSSSWLDPAFISDPVWRAYVAFKGETAHLYTKANYDALKAAATAAGKNPDDVYLGGNDIPDVTFGALNGDEMDQVNTEYNPAYGIDTELGRGVPPTGHSGSFYATAVSLEKSQHAIVWYYLDDATLKNKPNLGEVLGFEAVSNNAMLQIDFSWGRSPGTPASAAMVNATVERLKPSLGHRVRKGAVALVFGTFTQATSLAPGGFVPAHLDHALGFAGWAEALEERHTPYRVIPDYKLPKGIPDDVKVLVLPHVRAIDPATVDQVLVPFALRGGTILVSGADSGSVKTRDFAYASNPAPLLYALTQQGRARFIQGNPGLDFYKGNRESASRKATAKAQIDAALASLSPEVSLGGWGARVWATRHDDELGARAFVDLLNADLDTASDTLTPSGGGTLTFELPQGGATAKWYDADGAGAVTLPATPVDATHVSVTIPPFRVWGSLALEWTPTPVITAIGTGCADDYCLWLKGAQFGARPAVEIGGATYADAELSYDVGQQLLTLALRPAERAAFAAGPLQVRVLDRDTQMRSAPATVSRPGTTAPPPTAQPPVIRAAGTGCADDYCLWILGSGLSAQVKVVLNGSITYQGAELSYDSSAQVVTLSLRPAERALFATQPLQVAVVNLDSGLGSGSITVTHPGTTPPQAPPPVIVNAGTGCADNYCLWVVGQQLEPSIAVELVDPTSNALLATYSGADLNYDLGAQTVTLALKQGSAERQRLTAGPLGVRVLNMASGLRSGMAQVSRP